MSTSLAPECNEVKERYDTCFLKWYSEKYLRGGEKDNKECAGLFTEYQKCLNTALKDRGIDKLLEEAREDNKENDVRLLGSKRHGPVHPMHPFSTLTVGIFVAGYITARWDLVTRLYELAIFAWEYGVVTRAAKGLVLLTGLFLVIFIPVLLVALKETRQHTRMPGTGVSARDELRRRGSF
ncbi:hypothetical protein S40288_01899 [Stachybotrys chartarum IBT 40288]|nr:hypothetical protein S40288_01899 [Stachybotrys chartarum IBT 40288]